MSDKTAQENVFGYDWKPANKRKPRCYEVLKFRRIEEKLKAEPMEYLAMWDGKKFYIFDLNRTKWIPLEKVVYPENVRLSVGNAELTANLLGWEYAYIPKEQSRYIPFHAIAMSSRHEVYGPKTKTGVF